MTDRKPKLVAELGTAEVLLVDRYRNDRLELVQHSREALEPKAQLAIRLIERFGVIAGMDGGEDSAGRQKAALMPPADVVERACSIADIAYDAFAQRGWLTKLPSYLDIFGDRDPDAA